MLIKYKATEPTALKGFKPHKILIVQTAFIGDVVLITALIRECAQLFPCALIDVMVIPSTKPLLEGNPYINRVVIYDKRVKGEMFKIIADLNKVKYDLAISPHSSSRTALVLYFSDIKIRLGYNRWFARHFLTHRVNHGMKLDHIPHKIEKLLNLLSVFTDKKLEMQTELYPNEQNRDFAQGIMSVNTLGKKVILVSPGSVWNTKRWKEEHFTQLIKDLLHEGYFIVLNGSPAEFELCENIYQQSRAIAEESIVNICGKSTLLDSAAIVEMSDLVICNDSGTLHIANAMKTTVFAFFGPTVKRFGYYPFREDDYVFEVDLPCRPCGAHGGEICPLKHHNCMMEIKPEAVLDKVLNYFKRD
ncbi:MAG TPA: lipopolysaccharide heptosyltransferase II [Candidatus Cloacimonadota bacterium]|jgi:heptosyltransferase-2|nr:lipopolysaccharide heptosyltransferase II [Candidatus Cloacimonadales bacterium]HPY95646.1 lipopolysaccharide heptosyltransferase II [Candidatus Cloacimonadota bacterium]HQB40876.1 lipopolysaccharide heptosyltransferase II [Candidatus Cloacimonadota bacterium]